MRIKKYRVFDIGNDHSYFNEGAETDLNNKYILERVARKSYLPTNRLLLKLLEKHPSFKLAYSFSGVFLEQIERDFPEVLKSFQNLIKTGKVEVLSETYYHSLSFIYSQKEFRKQVYEHMGIIRRLFGVTPRIFRNTELIYSNDIAKTVEMMGFKGMLAEGVGRVLDWRSPNFVYSAKGANKCKLLLKNFKLSDDIAFRFSEKTWKEYPLTAPKFARWIKEHNGNGELINLFMDYETFGEHQWEDKGIFMFLEALPGAILEYPDNDFVTPSEAIERYQSREELDFPNFVSWADEERDLSAWLSNPLQEDALSKLYDLEEKVINTKSPSIIRDWRRLQTSDHFYYMCTKWFADGDVHKYFNPYESPYDAFIAFINVLNDLKHRINSSVEAKQGRCRV
ncbi:MAG: glycoside hydrolase family 57 protein [Patescibacteria group bacterium]|nr:glycoside hydrolase family 57 protein [Patescibacteria group bacterium]